MMDLTRFVASLSCWCLLAKAAAAASSGHDHGILEVDMLFPHNVTYTPSASIPIVFAIQNPHLLRVLNPSILLDVWSDNTNMTKNFGQVWYLNWAQFTGNGPFFSYHSFPGFATEDHWYINWRFEFSSCLHSVTEYAASPLISNSTGGRVQFTTARDSGTNGIKELDLVAALQEDVCSSSKGTKPGAAAVEVTGTMEASVPWKGDSNNTCGTVATSLPIPSPCAVKINAKAAESIAARVAARPACSAADSPLSCQVSSTRSSGAQRLAAGSAACFAVSLGGLIYLLRFF